MLLNKINLLENIIDINEQTDSLHKNEINIYKNEIKSNKSEIKKLKITNGILSLGVLILLILLWTRLYIISILVLLEKL